MDSPPLLLLVEAPSTIFYLQNCLGIWCFHNTHKSPLSCFLERGGEFRKGQAGPIESRGPTTEVSWARAISQMNRSDSIGQQPSLAPAQMCLVIFFCARLSLSWKENMALSFPGSTFGIVFKTALNVQN